MPYVTQPDRMELDPLIRDLALALHLREQKAGLLNYTVTSLIDQAYCHRMLNYADMNEIIGMLECAKQEFYRRVAAPYEDKKKEANGDVYPYSLTATREVK